MRSVSTTSSIETRTNSVVLYGRVMGDPARKARGEPRHRRLDASRHLEGVGAGQLEDADERGRLPAHSAEGAVALGAQLDPGDVTDAEQRAVGPRAEDDVLELGRRRQAPARGDRVLELLPGSDGGWPICPAAAWRFCSRTASATSPAVSPRPASRSGFSQSRMP